MFDVLTLEASVLAMLERVFGPSCVTYARGASSAEALRQALAASDDGRDGDNGEAAAHWIGSSGSFRFG